MFEKHVGRRETFSALVAYTNTIMLYFFFVGLNLLVFIILISSFSIPRSSRCAQSTNSCEAVKEDHSRRLVDFHHNSECSKALHPEIAVCIQAIMQICRCGGGSMDVYMCFTPAIMSLDVAEFSFGTSVRTQTSTRPPRG
jgi:hypothetical protein